MTARFAVLASGSSGNASLLEVDGFGLLLDFGLNPRTLTAQLAAAGASWKSVHAAVLTHTHTDHWKAHTLATLRQRRIPVYAHPAQLDQMARCAAFDSFFKAGLARPYADGARLDLGPGLACTPVRVSHDCDPTFAFRVEHRDGGDGPAWVLGYASDLGCASDPLLDAFVGADVLALEFNHDEALERNSRRPQILIERVLGDDGHLSNRQAADVTAEVLARSAPGLLTHLVQLHLSRDCNRPDLAAGAGRRALLAAGSRAAVVTAAPHTPTAWMPLARTARSARRTAPRVLPVSLAPRRVVQPQLPGFEVA